VVCDVDDPPSYPLVVVVADGEAMLCFCSGSFVWLPSGHNVHWNPLLWPNMTAPSVIPSSFRGLPVMMRRQEVGTSCWTGDWSPGEEGSIVALVVSQRQGSKGLFLDGFIQARPGPTIMGSPVKLPSLSSMMFLMSHREVQR